jgi:hypothetical protein
MPKAVQTALGVAVGIPLAPGMLLIFVFPIVLEVKFPTQATLAFLGLVLVASGTLLMTWGLRSWLRADPRTLHALIHRTSLLWAGLVFFAGGCLLCLFRWSDDLVDIFSVLASICVGMFLFAGWLMPAMWETRRNQRARQARASTQESAPPRQQVSPLFAIWMLFGCALGYALFFLTLNGKLAVFLTAHLSYQPPFGPIPSWVFVAAGVVFWACSFLFQVPASLRWRPPRQRFLFLLARRVFGFSIIFYGIFIPLELSHRPSEGETDSLFALLVTLGVIAGLTYLAAWAVVGLSRWRAARHREA